jgi:PAS domain S-box-containing protein
LRRLEGINTSEERLRELEQTIKNLRKIVENYRDLLQYAPTAIYEIDYKAPRLKTVNEEAIRVTGYTKEELLSLSPFKLLAPESSEHFKERLKRGAAGERIDENVEYKFMTKDGHDLWAVLYSAHV